MAKHGLLPRTPATVSWISALCRRRTDESRTTLQTLSSAVNDDGDAAFTSPSAPRVIRTSTIRQVHHLLFNLHALSFSLSTYLRLPRVSRLAFLFSHVELRDENDFDVILSWIILHVVA